MCDDSYSIWTSEGFERSARLEAAFAKCNVCAWNANFLKLIASLETCLPKINFCFWFNGYFLERFKVVKHRIINCDAGCFLDFERLNGWQILILTEYYLAANENDIFEILRFWKEAGIECKSWSIQVFPSCHFNCNFRYIVAVFEQSFTNLSLGETRNRESWEARAVVEAIITKNNFLSFDVDIIEFRWVIHEFFFYVKRWSRSNYESLQSQAFLKHFGRNFNVMLRIKRDCFQWRTASEALIRNTK